MFLSGAFRVTKSCFPCKVKEEIISWESASIFIISIYIIWHISKNINIFFLKMPRAFIYFVYSGTCPVMQWMFPPPTRISRA